MREGARGTHSRAMRWDASTKRVYATLKEMGGSKVLRFLHETLESPAESTVRAEIRRDKIDYEPGVKRSHFEAIGQVPPPAPLPAMIVLHRSVRLSAHLDCCVPPAAIRQDQGRERHRREGGL